MEHCACSTRPQECKRSRHSEYLGLLGERLLGGMDDLLMPYSEIIVMKKHANPNSLVSLNCLFFFFSYSYLISSIPSHSPAVLFAPASFFFLSTRLSAATLPSFLPRVFWHIDLNGISLEVSIVWLISSMHETPRLRGLRRQWSAHTQGQQHTLGTRVDLPSVA